MHNALRITLFTVISAVLGFNSAVQAKVIHQEKSLYRNILVEDHGDLRCLKFNVRSSKTQQSCLYKSDPDKLVFNYTKLLMSGLLFNPEPKRVLVIGLGGGTMSNTLAQLFPESHIDNIEIDDAVIKVARRYFGFFENERVKSYQQDGRLFIKRALLKKQSYDWIILDAFNGDYIPEHLLTKEFLQEAKNLLSEQGILTANTFSLSKLYHHESATYKAVFGDFYQVANGEKSNRVIIAARTSLANKVVAPNTVAQLYQALIPYNVDIKQIYSKLRFTQQHQDWPENTRILTDQFSPANLLNSD